MDFFFSSIFCSSLTGDLNISSSSSSIIRKKKRLNMSDREKLNSKVKESKDIIKEKQLESLKKLQEEIDTKYKKATEALRDFEKERESLKNQNKSIKEETEKIKEENGSMYVLKNRIQDEKIKKFIKFS
jgi:phosphomevalonate kinase